MKLHVSIVLCLLWSGAFAQKNAKDYFKLGGICLDSGNYVMAIKYYDSTLSLDSTNYDSYYNRWRFR